MRVTLVSPHDPSSPTCPERAPRLAAELARLGHDVTLLAPTRGRSRAGVERDVRVARVHGGPARLAAHLPREAEVVHVPAPCAGLTVRAVHAARRLGQPAVLDVQGDAAPLRALLDAPGYARAAAVLVPSAAEARAWRSLRGVPAVRWRALPDPEPGRTWAEAAARLAAVYVEVLRRPAWEVMPGARVGRHAVL